LTAPRQFHRGNELLFNVTHPESNGVYELQFTTNLSAAAIWTTRQLGLAGQTNFIIANPGTRQGFFRLRVPPLQAPQRWIVPEDVTVAVPGITLSGLAAADASLSLRVTNGVLELDPGVGIRVSPSTPTSALTLYGAQHDLNLALKTLRYRGITNYYGPDNLTVELATGSAAEKLEVSILVTPVNDPPEARSDAFTIKEDATLFVPAPGVLVNDRDVEGDPLVATPVTSPSHGRLSLDSDGAFTYQPDADYVGIDSFTYLAADNAGGGSVAAVTITILAANDAAYVRLIHPTNGASIAVGTPILLSVEATDKDGYVVQVDYVNGSNLLGTATSTPFTVTWNTANLGTHVLTARATDDAGRVAVSLPVVITVVSDCDGDGVSDATEVLNGTDPCDFFNGVPAMLAVEGNFQSGTAGTLLPLPLVVRVSNAMGVLRSNVPVQFTLSESSGSISASTNGPWTETVRLRTESNGVAAVWLRLPETASTLTLVRASADTGVHSSQETFAAATSGARQGWVLEDRPIAVAAGGEHTLGLLADGTVRAWGRNDAGQLGDGIRLLSSATPVPVPGISNVVSIAAGAWHSMALTADGSVSAWGEYLEQAKATPPAGLADVIAIAAGTSHSLALLSDGSVRAWGDLFTNFLPPANLSGVIAIAAGRGFSLALQNDGHVVAWGLSRFDQDFGQTTVPLGLSDVQAIAAGSFHCLALCANGTIVAWGLNNAGQTDVPPAAAGAVAIAAGADHSLALRADGTVVAWGNLNGGQPGLLSNLRDVVAIAAGGFDTLSHSVALRSDGTIQSWGANTSGQLGDGTQVSSATPVRVVGLPPDLSITNAIDFQVYTPLN
jgi:VCBS repeat-containing protein